MPKKPPRYDLPKAAPEPLRVVQLLVNTRDHEHGRELLASEEDLRQWLAERNLPLEGALLPRFQALREALRALLIANNEGAAPPSAALASLNAEARRSPLHLAAAQGLPELPLGVLRRVEEPLGHVVLDAAVREPPQDEALPHAPRPGLTEIAARVRRLRGTKLAAVHGCAFAR